MPAFTWPNDPEDAHREQLTLRDLVKLESSIARPFKFRSGIAIGSAYDETIKTACAAGVFFDDEGRCSKETLTATVETDFPYIPGLLAFRVGPAICAILDGVIDDIDLLLFDGQGIAHPRRFGLASHLGVLYDKPSIGVTKRILSGESLRVPKARFEQAAINHPRTKVTIGYALCLGDGSAPCYVSPGHRVSVKDAPLLIKQISPEASWFPSALRRAHVKANAMAKSAYPYRK